MREQSYLWNKNCITKKVPAWGQLQCSGYFYSWVNKSDICSENKCTHQVSHYLFQFPSELYPQQAQIIKNGGKATEWKFLDHIFDLWHMSLKEEKRHRHVMRINMSNRWQIRPLNPKIRCVFAVSVPQTKDSLMQALVCIKQRTLLDHVLPPRTKIVEQDLFFVSIFGIRCSLFDDNGYPSRNAITFTIIIIFQINKLCLNWGNH